MEKKWCVGVRSQRQVAVCLQGHSVAGFVTRAAYFRVPPILRISAQHKEQIKSVDISKHFQL